MENKTVEYYEQEIQAVKVYNRIIEKKEADVFDEFDYMIFLDSTKLKRTFYADLFKQACMDGKYEIACYVAKTFL